MTKQLQVPSIVQQINKNKKTVSKSRKTSTRRRVKWNYQETALYLNFIQQNFEILSKTRKGDKKCIFNKMAAFVGTRNSLKCKSHHQKLLMKFKTIPKIIQNLKEKSQSQTQSLVDDIYDDKSFQEQSNVIMFDLIVQDLSESRVSSQSALLQIDFQSINQQNSEPRSLFDELLDEDRQF